MNIIKEVIRKIGKRAPMECKTEENVSNYAAREKAGWVSPAYIKSRSAIIDPMVAEKNRCVAVFPNAPEMEAFRILRRKILNLAENKGWNTFMITSALPGEGKTLTAINLSLTFAREFHQTVLLVDCDLRKQSIYSMLGIKSEKGLVDYLLRDTCLEDLIIWPNIDKFTLISGGRSAQDSAELLGSQKMKELFADMKTRYTDRFVIFDVPPLLSGADALTFMSLVDGVLLVVQADKTSVEDVNRSLEMIPTGKLLGLVVNRQKGPVEEYHSYPKKP